MMKLMKKVMGGCVSAKTVQSNFPVTLINDITDKHISSGTLYINVAEISYFPSGKVEAEYIWPLKYVRRYGRDRKLFSFEAGRRCPRGEGNFTFLTNRAEEIFKLIEFNLKLNNKANNGQGSVSPASSIATTTCQESVTPQGTPTSPNMHNRNRGSPEQPKYINVEVKQGPPPRPVLPKYIEMQFEEESHSIPQLPLRTIKKTEYNKIDFNAINNQQIPKGFQADEFSTYVNSRQPNMITYVRLDMDQMNKEIVHPKEPKGPLHITPYTKIDVKRTIALEQTIKSQRINVERKSISGNL
ncbi:Docking protein 3 [Oopsacas minuta]|uniref:Docking protein 3 n=1 Tax=Oopsacas minuta TaxID=111878 RepID=A0AAV7KD19_9METZ|nr:Docking protein 3 [Oopsacas minuta]